MMQRNGVETANSPSKNQSRERRKRENTNSVVVGVLHGIDQSGVLRVDYPSNSRGCLPARSTVNLSEDDIGREVVLMFEEGDPNRPLVVGVLQVPIAPTSKAKLIHPTVDGETVTISAENEIVLRCGEASITLTRNGKIYLRGTYLLSRSSGVNRIQGGSIELN